MSNACAGMYAARTARGLSFRELGRAVGVSPSYLHDLENGRRTPSRKVADDLNSVLGPGAVILPPTPEEREAAAREVGRLAGIEESARVVDEAAAFYPAEIFGDPPPGEHGRTVDSCSARALRRVLPGIAQQIRARKEVDPS